MSSIIKDPIIEQIKVLYELGDGGRYEIMYRTIFVIKGALILGKSSKECVDNMMDKGVKPLELGISLVIAMTRTNPQYLNGIDSSLRIKYMKEHADMIADYEKEEKMNE